MTYLIFIFNWQQTKLEHHWVHRKNLKGKCKHCSKVHALIGNNKRLSYDNDDYDGDNKSMAIKSGLSVYLLSLFVNFHINYLSASNLIIFCKLCLKVNCLSSVLNHSSYTWKKVIHRNYMCVVFVTFIVVCVAWSRSHVSINACQIWAQCHSNVFFLPVS